MSAAQTTQTQQQASHTQQPARVADDVISSNDQFIQLIFIDEVPSGYCNKAGNAKILIASIADKFERDLQTEAPGARVFRETSEDETNIKISRQRPGIILSGNVNLKHTLRFIPVPKFYKELGSTSGGSGSGVDQPPPPPPPPLSEPTIPRSSSDDSLNQ